MRAKAMLALGGAVVVSLGVTAGTLALFSATTPSQNSNVTAGTLSLTSFRDQGDTINGPMFYTTPVEGVSSPGGLNGLLPTGYWAPGDTKMRVLMVRNTGTLDAWLTGVGATMHAGTSSHLASKLEYKVTLDAAGLNVLTSGTLIDLINTDQAFSSNVALNIGPVPKALYFHVHLPLNADNSYQGETLRVDFHVLAIQKKNNP